MPANPPPDPRYQYSIYTFDSREIDQIVGLVRTWSRGGQWLPIDRRHYTRQVLDWAKAVGILEKWPHRGPWKDRLVYSRSSTFALVWSTPPEAVWRLVAPLIGDRTGASIARQPGWLDLNIGYLGYRHYSDRDANDQYRVMVFLDAWHYIHFNAAGSLWDVTRRATEEPAHA